MRDTTPPPPPVDCSSALTRTAWPFLRERTRLEAVGDRAGGTRRDELAHDAITLFFFFGFSDYDFFVIDSIRSALFCSNSARDERRTPVARI